MVDCRGNSIAKLNPAGDFCYQIDPNIALEFCSDGASYSVVVTGGLTVGATPTVPCNITVYVTQPNEVEVDVGGTIILFSSEIVQQMTWSATKEWLEKAYDANASTPGGPGAWTGPRFPQGLPLLNNANHSI